MSYSKIETNISQLGVSLPSQQLHVIMHIHINTCSHKQHMYNTYT